VSEQERNEYIKGIKYKTAGYVLAVAAGLLISGTVAVTSIKDDIKELGKDNKANNKEMRHYVDSLHHDDLNQFYEIWDAINQLPAKAHIKIKNNGCVIERIINNKRVFIPTDCNTAYK
jgi:hypothetical protein